VTKGKFLFIEGRLQFRSYEDREGKKRDVTQVVVTLLRLLGPAKNGNGAKAVESSKAAEAVDEADSPFNDAADAGTDMDVPF
jgi:single-strand DNA-binding protein